MFIKEKIQIDSTAQGHLNGIPLGDYDAMINFAGGQTVARNPRKQLRLVEGNMNGAQKRFYLKQAFSMEPLQILKAFLKEGKARMVTERELELLRLLEDQGVPVMHPVAWGSRRLLSIPLSGYLLVEEVQGKRFTEMYEALDELERRRLMTAYGALVGFMHKKGLDSIVRVTDMICVSKDFNDFKRSLVVIDREWGSLRRKKISFKKRCEQLGKMFAKMLRWIGLPTDREVISFTRGYLKESQDLNYSISQVLERSTFYALKSIKGKAKYDQIRERLEGFVRKKSMKGMHP
jgi:tRNA A-37 threonylcarbamoyl transferase component Bud32